MMRGGAADAGATHHAHEQGVEEGAARQAVRQAAAEPPLGTQGLGSWVGGRQGSSRSSALWRGAEAAQTTTVRSSSSPRHADQARPRRASAHFIVRRGGGWRFFPALRQEAERAGVRRGVQGREGHVHELQDARGKVLRRGQQPLGAAQCVSSPQTSDLFLPPSPPGPRCPAADTIHSALCWRMSTGIQHTIRQSHLTNSRSRWCVSSDGRHSRRTRTESDNLPSDPHRSESLSLIRMHTRSYHPLPPHNRPRHVTGGGGGRLSRHACHGGVPRPRPRAVRRQPVLRPKVDGAHTLLPPRPAFPRQQPWGGYSLDLRLFAGGRGCCAPRSAARHAHRL